VAGHVTRTIMANVDRKPLCAAKDTTNSNQSEAAKRRNSNAKTENTASR
jgi:hypothetical protein